MMKIAANFAEVMDISGIPESSDGRRNMTVNQILSRAAEANRRAVYDRLELRTMKPDSRTVTRANAESPRNQALFAWAEKNDCDANTIYDVQGRMIQKYYRLVIKEIDPLKKFTKMPRHQITHNFLSIAARAFFPKDVSFETFALQCLHSAMQSCSLYDISRVSKLFDHESAVEFLTWCTEKSPPAMIDNYAYPQPISNPQGDNIKASRKLDPIGITRDNANSPRDFALFAWAEKNDCDGETIYEVQGRMIKTLLKKAMDALDPSGAIQHETIATYAQKILKIAAKAFFPKNNDASFEDFALSRIRAIGSRYSPYSPETIPKFDDHESALVFVTECMDDSKPPEESTPASVLEAPKLDVRAAIRLREKKEAVALQYRPSMTEVAREAIETWQGNRKIACPSLMNEIVDTLIAQGLDTFSGQAVAGDSLATHIRITVQNGIVALYQEKLIRH